MSNKKSKKARDIMTRDVIVIENNITTKNMIDIFLNHKISSAPVVNEEKKLVGIVTKTDVIAHYLDIDFDLSIKHTLKDIIEYRPENEDKIPSDTDKTVGDIMTPKPITVEEDTTIESLAKTMLDNNIHRLIIMKDNTITGIVSTMDILYHVAGIDKK